MSQNIGNMAQAETRKLAAIMFTDIVGFSHQMGSDEARMLRLLEVHNQIIQKPSLNIVARSSKPSAMGFW
jgi:hypothetical protein